MIPTRRVVLTPRVLTLMQRIQQIFEHGREGFWFSPLFPYLYDTNMGIASVDAAEDPVGLMVDRSKGLALGAELVDTINTAAAWTASGTNTVAQDGDAVKITYVDNAAGAVATFSAAGGLSANLAVDSRYLITYEIKVNSGSCNAAAVNASTNQNTAVTSTTYITQQFLFRASSATANTLTFANLSAGEIVWIKNISVKLLNGNHASQPTGAARPTYRVDANNRPYIAALGTDDAMSGPSGGGGSSGFFFCCAIKITGGAGTLRVIMGDGSPAPAIGYYVTVTAADKLAIYAGSGDVSYTMLPSVDSVSVDSTYVLSGWDDGTNLNVRVNRGSIVSTARPAVVAGTAGFSLFKHNASATLYLTADVYGMVYVKNSGLTASERDDVLNYMASKVGM